MAPRHPLLTLFAVLLFAGCPSPGDDDTGGGPGDDDDTGPSGEDPCDGEDNDGNGVVDDGFACAAGAVTDCTEYGTCVGTSVCGDDCTPGPCTNEAWACTAPGTMEPCADALCNEAQECLADCSWGECESHCGVDEACCPSEGCVNIKTDPYNCGECGRFCDFGDTPECFGGACCIKGCRNGSEICDDEHFSVSDPYIRTFLVCRNDNGGVAYLATNTGLACDDGIHRCRGWEENGMNAWDHLEYLAQMDCTTSGQYLEVDLSAHAGQGMYIGVHDQPAGGGHMTSVCVAEGP